MKRKTLYKIYKNGSYPTLASKNLLSLISSGGFSIRPLNCSRRLARILAWNKMTRNSIRNKGGFCKTHISFINLECQWNKSMNFTVQQKVFYNRESSSDSIWTFNFLFLRSLPVNKFQRFDKVWMLELTKHDINAKLG